MTVAAAVGQPGVDGAVTLYGSKSARRQAQQLRHLEVAEPAAEVADVDAEARGELVLHARRELPVVGRLPHPKRVSSSNCATEVSAPNGLRYAEHSPLAAGLS